MFEWLLVIGILIGALSPLLTFARLFQMKEWRLDRLGEHLRREGWFHSLFGTLNTALTCVYTIILAGALYLLFNTDAGWPGLAIVWFIRSIPWWVGAFAVITLLKIVLRQQRMPRWTTKAIALVVTALALTAFVAVGNTFSLGAILLPYLPIAQPLLLMVAWLLWKPIDGFMKRRLLANAAAHRATLKNATVIGIVGSVGKTTTKELLKCVLQDLNPIATPEHVNTELGVAAWIMKNIARGTVRARHAVPLPQAEPLDAVPVLIVEMGAYRKGEIATLCQVAQPTIGVVTALGSDHLALFGSEDAIIDANAEILSALPADGHAFLLGDNAASASLKQRSSCAVTVAGTADATNVKDTDRGLTIDAGAARFTVALHGMHNAGNVMLAVAVARHLGVKDERIRELLAGFRGSAHTFHLKKERGVLILDDTYNVSPLSFKAALDWAKNRSERPRILLTSGLLETGADEEKFLRELGAAAKKSVERVVFTTDAGRATFAEAFGKPVELLSPKSASVSDDGLLLCVGRMPLSTIQKLLPR